MEPGFLLDRLLRPAGGGVHLVSTGLAEREALQRRLYGVSSDGEVAAAHRAALGRIASARAVLLGVPSDAGAGYVRGSNLAPAAIRAALLDDGFRAGDLGLVDAGDVLVVPQLLDDEMCSPAQLARSRAALHPDLPSAERDRLPVSPLSAAEAAIEAILAINPDAVPVVLGGDHSCAWPLAAATLRRAEDRVGLVQLDAHTDLLEERLGVRRCFATWAYHANELLGRDGRLVQVGVRASRHDRGHWEGTLGVRQLWAAECRADPEGTIDRIVGHLLALGVERVHLSHDIDATDARDAPATGTPEPDGLSPAFVSALIRRLAGEFRLAAVDLVEVAPSIERQPGDAARTVALAARYLRQTLEAALSPGR